MRPRAGQPLLLGWLVFVSTRRRFRWHVLPVPLDHATPAASPAQESRGMHSHCDDGPHAAGALQTCGNPPWCTARRETRTARHRSRPLGSRGAITQHAHCAHSTVLAMHARNGTARDAARVSGWGTTLAGHKQTGCTRRMGKSCKGLAKQRGRARKSCAAVRHVADDDEPRGLCSTRRSDVQARPHGRRVGRD